MKNLIIIRHAKSRWNLPLEDIDRTLEQRGVSDAKLVAASSVKILPQSFVICSSIATRASATARIFAEVLGYPVERIVFNEELYTFDGSKLEQIVKSLDNGFDNIILFGHNEAITNFVNKFGDVSIENVPTSGLIFIRFDADNWQTITKGKTLKTIFPKDLK